MDKRSQALKLVLNHLGTNDISTVEDRMEVQKAVYLSQVAGVPLGYSYGWYVRGPYSPSLTRDYFELSDDLPENTTLKESAIQRLERVRTLMEAEIGHLQRPQKLELLASVHYLIEKSRLSEVTARKRLTDLKPHVAHQFSNALRLLRERGFLA